MRILTFTSLFPNSAAPNYAVFMQQRIAHFVRRPGHRVEVVAPVPYVPEFLTSRLEARIAAVPRVEEIAGLRVHHPRYPLIPKISMPLHAALMCLGCFGLVRRLHHEKSFDCIDAHYVFPDGLAALLIGRLLNLPVAITARGSDVHTFPQFATIRPQIRWALRHAAGVAAVSESLAKLMLNLEPSLKTVNVIGNGVDSRRFFPEDRALARRRLNLSATERIVVSVAALKHVKGPDLLIRAVALLRKSTPECRVLLVGSGPELSSLKRLASLLGCTDAVTFAGPVDNEELRYYYSAADVSCLASRNEGWPNVLLESLACGTPVVATDTGAARQILHRPELGLVVEPTPEAIHEGLRRALSQSWDAETISDYAETKTWENVAAEVESFLRDSVQKNFGLLYSATHA